jgi:hypothetical protein
MHVAGLFEYGPDVLESLNVFRAKASVFQRAVVSQIQHGVGKTLAPNISRIWRTDRPKLHGCRRNDAFAIQSVVRLFERRR